MAVVLVSAVVLVVVSVLVVIVVATETKECLKLYILYHHAMGVSSRYMSPPTITLIILIIIFTKSLTVLATSQGPTNASPMSKGLLNPWPSSNSRPFKSLTPLARAFL